MAESHGSSNPAFADRARQLAIDLACVLDAVTATQQYLPDPAKYMYNGSNALDQPDEKVQMLLSVCLHSTKLLTLYLF